MEWNRLVQELHNTELNIFTGKWPLVALSSILGVDGHAGVGGGGWHLGDGIGSLASKAECSSSHKPVDDCT